MSSCHLCGKHLCTKQALEYHLTKQKKCTEKFECTICGCVFRNKTKLTIHQTTCPSTLLYLISLFKNVVFDYIVLIDSTFTIKFSSLEKVKIDNSFKFLIHPNLRNDIHEWVFHNASNVFTKTVDHIPIHITCRKFSNHHMVFIKHFNHKYKLPGYLTPDFT